MITSSSVTIVKQQPHYENSEDFRKRIGKKIFDYESSKRDFNPKSLKQSDEPRSISTLVVNKTLSREDAKKLRGAGINGYEILFEDYWWGRTYWFYFFYQNGNSFSYDVYTKAKRNAVIQD